MSEVKRYSLTLHKVKGKFKSPEFERDNGEWVKWEDYARLKAEGDRLKEAGDEMAFHIGNDEESQRKCADRWFDLREGKQS